MNYQGIESAFNRLMEPQQVPSFKPIPTGWREFDSFLGGGYIGGGITSLEGETSSGKSSMALIAASEVQQTGKAVGYIDSSHTLDTRYAEVLGTDPESLLIHAPRFAEEGLEMACIMAESSEMGLIIIDSLDIMSPLAELTHEISTGLFSRLLSHSLTSLLNECRKSGVGVLVLDGGKSGRRRGYKDQVLNAVCDQRLNLRNAGPIKKNYKTIGRKIGVTVLRSITSPPNLECELDLLYAEHQ